MPALRAAIRTVAAWPGTTTEEASAIAGSARRVSSPPRRSPAAALRSRAQRDAVREGRTRPTSHHADHRRDQRDRHQRHRRPHGRRQRQQDSNGEDDLHDLPAGAFPGHGPQTAADVAASRPWLTRP